MTLKSGSGVIDKNGNNNNNVATLSWRTVSTFTNYAEGGQWTLRTSHLKIWALHS